MDASVGLVKSSLELHGYLVLAELPVREERLAEKLDLWETRAMESGHER